MTKNKYQKAYELGKLPPGYYYIQADDCSSREIDRYTGPEFEWIITCGNTKVKVLAPIPAYEKLQEAIKKIESVKEWIDTHDGMEYSSGLFYALKLLKGEGNEIDRLCDSINHTRRIENE